MAIDVWTVSGLVGGIVGMTVGDVLGVAQLPIGFIFGITAMLLYLYSPLPNRSGLTLHGVGANGEYWGFRQSRENR